MFRYNLYDIGVVVNRTLVYGALTATLGGAYLGERAAAAVRAQPVVRPGRSRARRWRWRRCSGPARSRIQAFVDRRFYRRTYDAQRTLDSFAARLRDEVALDALDAELRGGRARDNAARPRVAVGAADDTSPSGRWSTVLFVDIRGFTTFADRATAREAAEYLREFFDVVVPIVRSHTAAR